MAHVQFTSYTKALMFLAFILFLTGYLFANLLPMFTAIIVLIFLVYAKNSFKQSRGDLTITREIMEKLRFANHPINIKTTVTNNGGLLKLKATDVLPENTVLLTGENTREQLVKPGEEIVLDYQITFLTRGNHSFDAVAVEFTDRWNLYTVTTTRYQKTRVMVHSDPEEIKKAKRVSTREHIEITMPSLVGTETLYEMEGIRDYSPGDRLKDIEWKATSRLQKLMTKLFQKKEVVDTIILLDCSRSMRRTTGKTAKIDHATKLALHLTKILQSIRHPVGLIAYNEFKTLKTVPPSNQYQRIFEELTDLPDQIKTTRYVPQKTEESFYFTKENPMENQRFIATVFPFLAGGKRTIKHPSQSSGIYEAIRSLLMQGKTRHLIVLTDMETNMQSLYNSINLAHARKHKIWLLTPFSPYYDLEKKQVTPEQLEDLYKLHHAREKTLVKLRNMNIEIVELSPTMEGGKIIEKIRRKEA